MKTITIKKGLGSVIIPKQKHKILETILDSKFLQKIAPFLLLISATINTASAQVYSKIGDDPGHLDSSAVLEAASTSRGFLPPRMTKLQRKDIAVSPNSVGLQVWCTDCNTSTNPASGQLCVYLGSDVWAPLTTLITSASSTSALLTTAGNNDVANKPVKESATSVTISGTLIDVFNPPPTETGVVWREITDNDFATLPVLDATASNYKTTETVATTPGTLIRVTIPNLTSTNPYYFRTYAKNPLGIGYGNAVVFNIALPQISISPVAFTDRNTLLPVFKGKLLVNAGTPKGTITEYGYYSGTTNPPPTTEDAKVVLSATATGRLTLDLLNEKLNSETFTENPEVSLLVNDYNVKSTTKTYFRYYAIANGEPLYSDTVEFTPAAPVTVSISPVTFPYANTLLPVFNGKLLVNAGTPKGTITEYGYYSGTTNPPPTTEDAKVVLSTTAKGRLILDLLDEKLNSKTFTENPEASLLVNDYNVKSTTKTYFRYYAIANGEPLFSDTVEFTPTAPVTVSISPVTFTDGNTLLPVFKGKLLVNAGTPKGTITEYGYYSGITNPPPTTEDAKVVLSTTAKGRLTLDLLDEKLNSKTFTENPEVSLLVNDYNVNSTNNKTYFRYYAIANGEPLYSDTVEFTPVAHAFVYIYPVSFTDSNPLLPVFEGYLTADLGTPEVTPIHYGYYIGATNPPTIMGESVDLYSSTKTGRLTVDLLLQKANSKNFSLYDSQPRVSFSVTDYIVKSMTRTYVIFFVSTYGKTFYSNVVDFTPVADPVTGGTAIATLGTIEPISKPLKVDENSTSSFKVHFNVTKAGSYSFTPGASVGNTTGLTMPAVSGNFYAMPTDQTVTFTINGLPKTSLDGCSFAVPRIGPLSTGAIQPDPLVGNIIGGNALCDASHTTAIVPVYSPKTGRFWMDRNLGASQVATSSTDYKAYGCLYQWGRGNDGHASMNWTSATTGTPINRTTDMNARSDTPGNQFIPTNNNTFDWRSTPNSNLWQGVNGINNPCPTGFKVPTIDELNAELVGIANADTAYSSPLKLTYALFTRYSGGTNPDGAAYWSSTVDGDEFSYDLWFNSTAGSFKSPHVQRGYGLSIRCIKN